MIQNTATVKYHSHNMHFLWMENTEQRWTHIFRIATNASPMTPQYSTTEFYDDQIGWVHIITDKSNLLCHNPLI